MPQVPREHANDLTLWNCLHDCCKLGFTRFDLGEVAEQHPELIQFKTKWGMIIQPTYRYYYPRPFVTSSGETSNEPGPFSRIAVAAWERLPLGMTAWLGDWAFRFLQKQRAGDARGLELIWKAVTEMNADRVAENLSRVFSQR